MCDVSCEIISSLWSNSAKNSTLVWLISPNVSDIIIIIIVILFALKVQRRYKVRENIFGDLWSETQTVSIL